MFNKLKQDENSFYITRKKDFISLPVFKQADIDLCFNFAYDMTFGEKGEHRNHRSGGQNIRKKGEIFIDTFQGKLAEIAFYNCSLKKKKECSKPDFNTFGLNEWDGCDFVFEGKQVAIKSTKFFGNLLLLETKDWDNEGNYKPNYGTEHDSYDYFVLIRIKPEGTELMKRKRWLYLNELDKDELYKEINSVRWECDIPGYVTHDDIKTIINDNFILPQNSYLNGKTKMDAENYYIQLGDMRYIGEIFN